MYLRTTTGGFGIWLMRTGLLLMTGLLMAACPGSSSSSASKGGVSGNSGGSQAGSSSSAATTACTKLCALAQPLHCPNDKPACTTECESLYNGTICTTELRAMIACSIQQPASSWACDSKGEADVKAPACASEHTALDKCGNQ
jgi:hypothetical protein